MAMLRSLLLTVLLVPALAPAAEPAKAVFAAGCFWCTEEAFEKVPGVVSVTSGYMGGQLKNPTYEQVSTGRTGYHEVVQVLYDPAKVSYETLLRTFWLNHDPTALDHQFCDHGSQYGPGIYYYTDDQKREAEASKARWQKDKPFADPIVTPIKPATAFWPAEEYHQDYYKKNPARYHWYATGCGRYARLDELWGKYREKK